MTAVTYQEIREMAENLPNAALMKSWLSQRTGIWHSDKQLNDLLRGALPKESDYQSRIIKWLHSTYPGAFVWKAAAGVYSRQGIPDVCAVINGKFYGFEVKRPIIGKATKIQLETIRQIIKAGGIAAVVSTPKQVKEVIEKYGQD